MRQIKKTYESHRRFWILLAALLALVLVRYSFQINFPKAVFLAMVGLICLLGNQNEIIAMIICCIPLHGSIDFFFALAICMAVYLCRYWRKIRIVPGIASVLFMMIWELLHCFGTSFSVVTYLTYFLPFLVLVIVICSDVKSVDYFFVVRAFAVTTGAVCISLLLRVLHHSGYSIVRALLGLQRLGLDIHSNIQNADVNGGEINPNTLGIICTLAATGLMQIQYAKAASVKDIILACALIVFGALTASRTYLVCLALMVVLLLMSQRGSVRTKIRYLCVLTLVIAAAFLLFYICFPDLFLYYVGRFQVKDITTGRIDIMGRYNQFIFSDIKVLFFGIGLQHYDRILLDVQNISSVLPHNAIQELVIAWGVVGLFLLAWVLFWMCFRSGTVCRAQHLIHWIPLIIILVKSQAGQLLCSPYSVLALSYAYISLCADLSPELHTGNHSGTVRPEGLVPERHIF